VRAAKGDADAADHGDAACGLIEHRELRSRKYSLRSICAPAYRRRERDVFLARACHYNAGMREQTISRRTTLHAGLLALLAIAGSVQTFDSAAKKKIQPPTVAAASLTVLPGAGNKQRFRVALTIDNQNTEPVEFAGLKFTMRLAGEGVLDGRSAAGFTVAALDRVTVEVDAESEIVSSLSRLMSYTQGPSNALPYEIFGMLYLNRRINNALPFSRSGEVPLATTATR
jgi:hypothetical protein